MGVVVTICSKDTEVEGPFELMTVPPTELSTVDDPPKPFCSPIVDDDDCGVPVAGG